MAAKPRSVPLLLPATRRRSDFKGFYRNSARKLYHRGEIFKKFEASARDRRISGGHSTWGRQRAHPGISRHALSSAFSRSSQCGACRARCAL